MFRRMYIQEFIVASLMGILFSLILGNIAGLFLAYLALILLNVLIIKEELRERNDTKSK